MPDRRKRPRPPTSSTPSRATERITRGSWRIGAASANAITNGGTASDKLDNRIDPA